MIPSRDGRRCPCAWHDTVLVWLSSSDQFTRSPRSSGCRRRCAQWSGFYVRRLCRVTRRPASRRLRSSASRGALGGGTLDASTGPSAERRPPGVASGCGCRLRRKTQPVRDPVQATYFLFHDANLATLQEALLTVSACDLSAVYTETPTEDPALISSTYVLPTGDRTLSTAWMRRAARQRLECEPIEMVAAAHNFYVASPDEVAAIIDEAARAL